MNRRERLTDLSPTRRALLGAGIATLGLSLVLSIAPAWAKNTSGTVKVHDVTTGASYDDSSNDPYVCTFTVVFDFNSPTESGTWQIESWAPTGDGSVVATGTYDTSTDGTDETAALTLDAGHYRLEYQATGSHSSKTKTFWVAGTCGAADASASEDPTPTPTASATASDVSSPSEDPTPSATPSDDPAPTATPTDTPTDASSPTEDPTPSAAPSDTSIATDEPTPTPAATSTATPTAAPTATPAATSSDDPTPTDDPAPTATPAPEGAVEATTGSSAPSATPVEQAPAGNPTTAQLPDTSITDTVPLTSLLTALGLLLIVAAHPFIRRSAHADRA